MCGRYALYSLPEDIKLAFNTENIISYNANYNVAPSQALPIVIKNRMGFASWGFKPPTSPYSQSKGLLFNARAETVDQKVSFKESWNKKRRCLIPCNGFYEWKKSLNNSKPSPYFIKPEENELFALAGIWTKDAENVCFTILTQEADPSLKEIHHRMPVIIQPQDYSKWFSKDYDNIQALTKAIMPKITYYRVGQNVGNAKNNDKSLITPLNDALLSGL